MPIEREEIRTSIKKKGFREEPGRTHDMYWFFIDGKRTKWWIRLSRGADLKVYSDHLIGRQARVLKVRFRDLFDFLDCKMGQAEFGAILARNDI